jgi:hypothetical protein
MPDAHEASRRGASKVAEALNQGDTDPETSSSNGSKDASHAATDDAQINVGHDWCLPRRFLERIHVPPPSAPYDIGVCQAHCPQQPHGIPSTDALPAIEVS